MTGSYAVAMSSALLTPESEGCIHPEGSQTLLPDHPRKWAIVAINSVALQTSDTWIARFTALNAGVLRLMFSGATGNGKEQVLFVDELIARIIGSGVHPRVHSNRVARASLHTESAKNAAEFVDHKSLGILFVP